MGIKFIGIREAAKVIHRATSSIYRYCDAHPEFGVRHGKRGVLLTETDVAMLRKAIGKRGRPKEKK